MSWGVETMSQPAGFPADDGPRYLPDRQTAQALIQSAARVFEAERVRAGGRSDYGIRALEEVASMQHDASLERDPKARQLATESLLDRVRRDAGQRVEFAIYELATGAAVAGKDHLLIAEPKRFTPEFEQQLAVQLPIAPDYKESIFSALLRSLQEFINQNRIKAAWGELYCQPTGEVLVRPSLLARAGRSAGEPARLIEGRQTT